MLYNSLIAALPRQWFQILNIFIPLEPTLLDLIYHKPKMSSFLYTRSQNNFKDRDGCCLAWSRDLNLNIDIDSWNKIITQVHKITEHTDLTYFQYRIIHRILTTNRIRNKWDSNVDPRCQFCKDSTETPIHLLCDCYYVKPLWHLIQKWLRKLLKDPNIVIDNELIILNVFNGVEKSFVNTVLLIVKKYIYYKKCQNEIPQTVQLIPRIQQTQVLEKAVALRNNQTKKYAKKWKVFLAWLYP